MCNDELNKSKVSTSETARRLTLCKVPLLLDGMMKSYVRFFAVIGGCIMGWTVGVNAAQTGVINAERVNVRTQPSIVSEVVAQVNTGDKVQVLEFITLNDTIPGNPAEWYRIAVPEGAKFWVSGDYIDSGDDTVTASQLNVRAGPGQSYTVMARLNRGEKVERILESDGWVSIKPPAEAFAYVATSLVDLDDAVAEETKSQEPPPVVILDDPSSGHTTILKSTVEGNQADETVSEESTQPTEPEKSLEEEEVVKEVESIPPAEVSTQEEMAEIKPQDEQATPITEENTATEVQESGLRPIDVPVPMIPSDGRRLPAETLVAENPVDPADELRRIVTREGIVKRSRSIQSPTYHRLEDPDTHRTMNYLYTGRLHLETSASSADLVPYEGYKIRVTGQESVDPRWPRIPVIEIEKLDLAD
jgi:uncharacterized protein YgiM (DUF1202 family)